MSNRVFPARIRSCAATPLKCSARASGVSSSTVLPPSARPAFHKRLWKPRRSTSCGKVVSIGQVGPKASPPSAVLVGMSDEVKFLLDAAEQLREIALSAPDIAAELRRLADELEATAVELGRDRRPMAWTEN